MATIRDRALLRQLGTLFNLGAIRELTDGQLLERFAREQDEAAELAFAALVERHAAMVVRVCRAQLADPNDVQDAVQATFLVLIQKARGLWVRESLGPWLHQVALRTASYARISAQRRRRLERQAAEVAAVGRAANETDGSPELARRLHEEIGRLPERYRVPIVLCDLEGRTCEEAARTMGRPVGTIKCWRARGRERLRSRLIRAGLAPAIAVEAVMSGGTAQAAAQIVQRLTDCLSAGVVPAPVSRLVRGVIQSMFVNQLRMAAAGVCVLTFLGAGLAAGVPVAGDEPKQADSIVNAKRVGEPKRAPTTTDRPAPAQEVWHLSLRDAIRIALDNSEIVRVVKLGPGEPVGGQAPSRPGSDAAPIVIARVNLDADAQRFRAEIMTQVSLVEQSYWDLATAQTRLWATEQAVQMAHQLLDRVRDQMKTGNSSAADLNEVTQRLEQFQLQSVTQTSDVITAERRLRHVLGLPPADNRRIVPSSQPTEAGVEPDRETARAAMMVHQPDIVQQKALIEKTQLTMASLVGGADGSPIDHQKFETTRQQLLRNRARLEAVVLRSRESLEQALKDLDTHYHVFRLASRNENAARQRLNAQRTFYEEGSITIDRFLDAITQFATSVGTTAEYRAAYNVAIAGLEQAKGTLLEFDGIKVAEKTLAAAPQTAAEKSSMAADSAPAADSNPAARSSVNGPQPREGKGAGTTYSFQFTINPGARPIEIKGSFTVTPSEK